MARKTGKISERGDDRMDRKKNIKETTRRDTVLDARRGLKPDRKTGRK